MSTQSLLGRARCRCHAGGRRPFTSAHTPRRYPRDRAVDVRHIALDLTLSPESRSLSGTCSLTLRPFSDGLFTLLLDAKEMTIESISIEGQSVRFSHDGAALLIAIWRTYNRDQEFTLVIRYRATPRRGLYFIAPDEGYPNKHRQVWTQGQDEDARYWFPCFDYPNQKSTTELTARVPLGWFALSNGSLLDHRQEDGARGLPLAPGRPPRLLPRHPRRGRVLRPRTAPRRAARGRLRLQGRRGKRPARL